jgi:hypothetical protein
MPKPEKVYLIFNKVEIQLLVLNSINGSAILLHYKINLTAYFRLLINILQNQTKNQKPMSPVNAYVSPNHL